MANQQNAGDPLAAATQKLMAAVQGYVRASIAAETAKSQQTQQPQPGDAIEALKSQLEARENRDLKPEFRKESMILSGFNGDVVLESKLTRHLASKKGEFHVFEKLPLELRMKIWELALPPSRIFQLSAAEHSIHLLVRANHAVGGGAQQQVDAAMNRRFAAGLPELAITPHSTPKLRLACREANRAFLQTGSFEFGLFGGSYKGVWFNHAEDIFHLQSVPANWTNMDVSRVIRVALCHSSLMSKESCIEKLDVILDHFIACREVVMLQAINWEYRQCLPYHRGNTLYYLRDDDVIGQHDYPEELSADMGKVAKWKDVKRVVEHLWLEHAVKVKMLGRSRVPRLVGMDMLRSRPGYLD